MPESMIAGVGPAAPTRSALFGFLLALVPILPAAAQPGVQQLEREFGRIARAAPATVGVGMIHVESGRQAFVNGQQWFPMASTYKIPMALEILNRVERGALRLDSLVTLQAADMVPFGSLLTERFGTTPVPGVALSVRHYLDLMLTLSDNTATDALLRLIGGTGPVQARLAALGIRNMLVSRSVSELGAAWLGFQLPAESERTVFRMRELLARAKPEQVKAGSAAFLASRKDHTTPRAMAELLAKIARGEALSRSSADTLISIMTRDETGRQRIRGRLPEGIRVASKTGTIESAVENDVGLIFLPDGTRLAIAVYLKDARAGSAELERVIADLARAAYDYFVLNPG